MQCPNCHKFYTPELLQDPRNADAYAAWKNGALVQVAFPNATPTQREQLITGMCSDECWNAFLGLEEKHA